MQPDPKDYATEFDRSSRGFPSFGYRLRKLEQRVRHLEAALSTTTNNDRHTDAENTDTETTDGRFTER